MGSRYDLRGDARMELPVLVIRGFVLFPGQLANFEVAREISIRAIEEAIAEGEHIFIYRDHAAFLYFY